MLRKDCSARQQSCFHKGEDSSTCWAILRRNPPSGKPQNINKQTHQKLSFTTALSPGCFLKPNSKEEVHLDFACTWSALKEAGKDACVFLLPKTLPVFQSNCNLQTCSCPSQLSPCLVIWGSASERSLLASPAFLRQHLLSKHKYVYCGNFVLALLPSLFARCFSFYTHRRHRAMF